MLPIKVQARAAQQAAGAVKCAAGVVARAVRAWQEARRAEEEIDDWWLDEDERHDEIDRTEIDAAAAGLDEQVDEEEHFDLGSGDDGGGGEADLDDSPDHGGESADGAGDEDDGGGVGGSSGAGGAGGGSTGDDAADGGPGLDDYADRESATGDDAGQGDGPDSDDDPAGDATEGQRDGSDDSDDPDWEPTRRRMGPLRPWHTAETAGRIGQVALLRAQHGYRRQPGATVEQLLRDSGELTWRLGLSEAARPAAAHLRQALLGWTAREPVPASEAFARDGPAWQQQANAGEAPAKEAAPSPLPPTPWEVEEGPTEDRERVIDGSEERLRARVAGKARQRSPGSAHREATGRPSFHERSRQSREGGGAAADGRAEERRGGGGEGGGGDGSSDDGAGVGGGRKRPLQGAAERADGEGEGDGEQRAVGGAAPAGSSSDAGGGDGTGGRGTRRRRHTGGKKRGEQASQADRAAVQP